MSRSSRQTPRTSARFTICDSPRRPARLLPATAYATSILFALCSISNSDARQRLSAAAFGFIVCRYGVKYSRTSSLPPLLSTTPSAMRYALSQRASAQRTSCVIVIIVLPVCSWSLLSISTIWQSPS